MWVGNKVVAGLSFMALVACGDDDSCQKAREIEEGITLNATEVDQISPIGICTLSEAEIANRLRVEGVPSYDQIENAQARAKQYVANCEKLSDLRAACHG
jgi:hypothetical protein